MLKNMIRKWLGVQSEDEINERFRRMMKEIDRNSMNAVREVDRIIHHSNFVKSVVSEINAYQIVSGKKGK